MSDEQLGMVQRLRNGGQPDLADDAEQLLRNLQCMVGLLDGTRIVITSKRALTLIQEALQEANAAIDQAQGTPR